MYTPNITLMNTNLMHVLALHHADGHVDGTWCHLSCNQATVGHVGKQYSFALLGICLIHSLVINETGVGAGASYNNLNRQK